MECIAYIHLIFSSKRFVHHYYIGPDRGGPRVEKKIRFTQII